MICVTTIYMRLHQPEGQLVLLYYVVKRTAPSENTLQENSQEKRLGRYYQSSHPLRPRGGQLDWEKWRHLRSLYSFVFHSLFLFTFQFTLLPQSLLQELTKSFFVQIPAETEQSI